MKGLILLIGESFREGGQYSRLRDTEIGKNTQFIATESHVNFIKKLNEFGIETNVIINTYETKYENELKSWYNKNIIKILINDELIGIKNLVNNALKSIETNNYDFIIVIRIDLFLKEQFVTNIINKINCNKILFPFITWTKDCEYNNCPRVADTILFIPKKYFYLTREEKQIYLSHDAWYLNKINYGLSSSDMDVMIYTFHDSDSSKDFNPLYYMVSRSETNNWFSDPNVIFDPNIDINKYKNQQNQQKQIVDVSLNKTIHNQLINKEPINDKPIIKQPINRQTINKQLTGKRHNSNIIMPNIFINLNKSDVIEDLKIPNSLIQTNKNKQLMFLIRTYLI